MCIKELREKFAVVRCSGLVVATSRVAFVFSHVPVPHCKHVPITLQLAQGTETRVTEVTHVTSRAARKVDIQHRKGLVKKGGVTLGRETKKLYMAGYYVQRLDIKGQGGQNLYVLRYQCPREKGHSRGWKKGAGENQASMHRKESRQGYGILGGILYHCL